MASIPMSEGVVTSISNLAPQISDRSFLALGFMAKGRSTELFGERTVVICVCENRIQRCAVRWVTNRDVWAFFLLNVRKLGLKVCVGKRFAVNSIRLQADRSFTTS